MANTKKFLYIYGTFLFLSWGFMFAVHKNDYTGNEITQGMLFITVVTIVYFTLVNLNYKSESGKKIVLWSLLLIAIISFLCVIFIKILGLTH